MEAQMPNSASQQKTKLWERNVGVENGGEHGHTQDSELLLGAEDQCESRKGCVWATGPQEQVLEPREQVAGTSQAWNRFLPQLTFRSIMAVPIPAKDGKRGIYAAGAH